TILRRRMAILPRFCELPAGSCFLFGPRGTGKTTWLRERLPAALHVNLLRAELYRELRARPERLVEMVRGAAVQDVVIDEIQRAPELLEVVHDLLESPSRLRFVLTGSSARKLRRGGVDLLAGRAVVRTLHPFMGGELPEFELGAALATGMLPLVVAAADARDTLSSYAALYLEQEVQAEGLVRNVGAFARFLEVVSFSHGSVLNISNVARETQASRKTVEGYVEILEDLLLGFRVPVFTRRAQRATVAHPKFYLFDAGVYRSLRPRGPLDRPGEIEGAALEGLIAQHLRAWIAYGRSDLELSYWRTRSGVEVDFVVYGEAGFWAIEVKNSRVVRSADVRALQSFAADYPACEPMLLYRGADRLVIGGVRCIPVEEFLSILRPGIEPTAV
ncbi:MAG TPA: AAA family ATPase, partial [Longimicrobiales bacterium]|nr:AAA family ATPase [Longimicrobiales bacterium]